MGKACWQARGGCGGWWVGKRSHLFPVLHQGMSVSLMGRQEGTAETQVSAGLHMQKYTLSHASMPVWVAGREKGSPITV